MSHDEWGNGSGNRSKRRTDVEHRMRSMRRWRYAISGAAVALGVVLLVTGHALVGLIIGGLAGARLVMYARFSAGRGGARRPPVADATRQWLRAHARDEFIVAARVIGCSAVELRGDFRQGRSIAEVATERVVGIDQVASAITADLSAKARDAARTGALSPDDAARIETLAPRLADRLVHGHRGAFRAHA